MNLEDRSWRGQKQEGLMRRNQSIGEMISTVTFVGLAAYLLIFSLDILQSGEFWRGMGGLLAAGG